MTSLFESKVFKTIQTSTEYSASAKGIEYDAGTCVRLVVLAIFLGLWVNHFGNNHLEALKLISATLSIW